MPPSAQQSERGRVFDNEPKGRGGTGGRGTSVGRRAKGTSVGQRAKGTRRDGGQRVECRTKGKGDECSTTSQGDEAGRGAQGGECDGIAHLQRGVLDGVDAHDGGLPVVERGGKHELGHDLVPLGAAQPQRDQVVRGAQRWDGVVVAPTRVHKAQVPAPTVLGHRPRTARPGRPMGVVHRHGAGLPGLSEGECPEPPDQLLRHWRGQPHLRSRVMVTLGERQPRARGGTTIVRPVEDAQNAGGVRGHGRHKTVLGWHFTSRAKVWTWALAMETARRGRAGT